ncbi:MAG: FG-GAP-like repeat-containing protein, partial [Opitutaceae bacterium]
RRAAAPLRMPELRASAAAVDETAEWQPEAIGEPIGDYPWIAQVTTCDLDGDGLVDVLACDCRKGEVVWLRQTQRGKFKEIVLASGIPAPVHVTPVKGGIYGSGHTDLIVSSMGEVFPDNDRIGAIYILENDGHEHFKKHLIADHIARVTDVEVGDLAGNGRKDLAVGCFGYDQGEILWMENEGNWKFKSHPLLDLSGTINVCIADFCGHHANDIAAVVSQQWEEIYLFQNDGRGHFTPKILWGSTNQDYGSSGISACDLNEDGRPDILYTNGDGFGPAAVAGPRPWHGVQWLENLGNGQFAYHRVANLPGAYSPVGVDLDGSGAMGILVVSAFANGAAEVPRNPSLVWYRNDGHEHFTPHILARTPKDQITVAVGDLDGTGRPVIVTGGFYVYPPYDHMGRITLWRRRSGMAAGALPARRDLAGRPAALTARIDRLEGRIRAGSGGIAALGELSRLYHANGLYLKAARCYETLIEEDAGNPRWYYRYAMILSGFGRLNDALPLFRRSAELAPKYVPAWIRIGDALLKLNRPEAATAAYGKALARDPDNPYALFGLARLDVAAGRWEDARAKLEICVKRSDWRVGYDLLPTVYEQLGQAARAAEIRGRMKASGAYQDMADPWMNELVADCYDAYRVAVAAGESDARGDPDNAIILMQRALSLAPGDPMQHFQLARYYSETHRLEEAAREYERCTELKPSFADAWVGWAGMLHLEGDDVSAERVLIRGLGNAPDAPGLHLEYGRLLTELGRLPEAMAQYEESVRLHPPEEAAPYIALGQCCFQLGRLDEGLAWLRRALAVEPDQPVALSALATYEIRAGDEATARVWVRRARRQPRIPAAQMRAITAAFESRFGSAP